jgi:hypothetical protein
LRRSFRSLRAKLDEERKKRGDLEVALKASIESHVNRRAPAFSIDSQATDVEYSAIEDFKTALRSVAEEESEDYSDQDDELANYEQEMRMTILSPASSQPSALSRMFHVRFLLSKAEIAATPSHSRRASLVKAWTFPSVPRVARPAPSRRRSTNSSDASSMTKTRRPLRLFALQ